MVVLAASPGIRLQVSKRGRLEGQTVIDLIPVLCVCALPDGPLEFGGGSWLTSRKSIRSFKVLHPRMVGDRSGSLRLCQPSPGTPNRVQCRSDQPSGLAQFPSG